MNNELQRGLERFTDCLEIGQGLQRALHTLLAALFMSAQAANVSARSVMSQFKVVCYD